MKILWFTWKDKKNPQAGGAEMLAEEIAKRLAGDGHEVIFIVGGYPGAVQTEHVDGYQIIRVGNRWTVYWRAFRYYRKALAGWADVLIEEINTIPFFTRFYLRGEKKLLFIPQLCREIWFYEMVFPLSLIGYLAEPIYLRLLKSEP